MAEAEFYTYIHRKADTGEVFYVGKGKGNRAFSKNGRSRFWQSVVANHDFKVEIAGVFADETKAFFHEKELIANFRLLGFRLCNMTDGGEGVSGYVMPESIIKARSAAIAEAFKRPEVKARRSAAISKAQKGKKLTDEHKAKLSIAHKGKPLSESHKLGLKNRVFTLEHRAALVAANARPDVKEKRIIAISKAMKGYVKTDEHRAALSAAAKADWAKRKKISSQ